jgi:hypothetical protein
MDMAMARALPRMRIVRVVLSEAGFVTVASM